MITAGELIVTLSALGVKGSRRAGFAEAEFSLSRMFTSRGFKKPARLLMRGVELSTADMRAAFALRLTTDGLRLRRAAELDAFLADLGTAPDLLALGPVEGTAKSVMCLHKLCVDLIYDTGRKKCGCLATHLESSCQDEGTQG